MNTRASVAYGWGLLVVAGGGAYFFAKRSINADRQERLDLDERRRQAMYKMQYGGGGGSSSSSSGTSSASSQPQAPSSSATASAPPDKEGHANPGKDAHQGEVAPSAVRDVPQSKFETQQPFRSKKGDRFS